MGKAIHFKTTMFDVSMEKENPVNPVYDVSLLLWLKDELKSTLNISEPDAEDWGWYSELEWQGSNYMIGASTFFEEGDDPREQLEWVFQIEKYRSLKQKLLGKNKMTEDDSCLNFFKELFEKHPEIKDIEIS